MITLVSRNCGLLLTIALGAAAAACTTPAAGRPGPAAEVTVPGKETTVLDTSPGAASALGVSTQLFRRAPVVVVAAADDRTSTRTAATLAARIGAPVLLGPVSEPLRRELDRLAPKALVAVGAKARQLPWDQATSARVYATDSTEPPAGLPDLTRPGPARVTVLVDDTCDDTAATATARAAGATVVPVHGADPRTDPAAIKALHARPPGVVLAVGRDFGPPERLRDRLRVTATGTQLPGGGQVVLHNRRFVCLYGHPGTASLGVLGEQGIDAGIARAKKTAASYEQVSDVPVVPTFELIATVAQGSPGADGDYSREASVDALRPWVERAGDAGLYVVLDLQPGRADLTAQARGYEPLLRMPHVGLADGMPLGWKNFHDEDHPMLTPAQTMANEPKPVVITYQ